MNKDIENISIFEKNINNDSFIYENNAIEKSIIKKINKRFYVVYILLIINICVSIIKFVI